MSPSTRWVHAVLALGAIPAALSCLALGFLQVWFQLDGSADRGDYAVASGLYDGGLVLMLLGLLAGWLSRAPRWLRVWCGAAAVVLALAALRAHLGSADADRDAGYARDMWAGGVAIVLRMPWDWLVVVALVLAVVARLRASGDPAGASGR